MFSDEGYTTLFRLGGMPVRLHWSFPLGMLVVGGIRFAPGLWLSYFLLVAAHELGHGVLARRAGCAVVSLDVHGFGGLCSYAGDPSEYEQAVIAWGGVLAQGVLFAIIHGVVAFVGPPRTDFSVDLVRVLTHVNVVIAMINLLPLNGLDGAQAWKLPRFWWQRVRRRRAPAPRDGKLGAAFAEKLRQTPRGPFTKDEGTSEARVVRIERGPGGAVRVVVVEEADEPERIH